MPVINATEYMLERHFSFEELKEICAKNKCILEKAFDGERDKYVWIIYSDYTNHFFPLGIAIAEAIKDKKLNAPPDKN